jgi:hypothetical protein
MKEYLLLQRGEMERWGEDTVKKRVWLVFSSKKGELCCLHHRNHKITLIKPAVQMDTMNMLPGLRKHQSVDKKECLLKWKTCFTLLQTT